MRIPAAKARTDFAEILNRAAFGKERVVLHRHNKDVAALICIEDLRLLESASEGDKDRRLAEEAMFQLAAIVESSNDAIIGKSLDGIIASWNPSAKRLYGYAAEEVVGKPISVLIPPDLPNQLPQILDKIRRGETVEHFETVRMRKDGKRIDVSITVSPIRDAVGNIIGASTIARDITERKQVEEELKTSRGQLRALSARLQGLLEQERDRLAHEIQGEFGQVLTALKIDLAWLAKRLPTDRETLQKKIEKMTDLLDRTIRGMHRISTELRPRAIDDFGLATAIEWEVQEFKKRTGIECRLTVSPEEIKPDTARSIAVFRILQEILAGISERADASTIEVRLKDDSAALLLEVGFTNGEEKIDQRSIDLVGIRERALIFGGEARMRKSRGGETVIAVVIPMPARKEQTVVLPESAQPPLLIIQQPAARKLQKLGKNPPTRILIADQHAIVREGIKQILGDIPDMTAETGEAGNGQEMLNKIRGGDWDIVVMDISLPDKNGLDVLKQVKSEYPKLPILILSAQAEEQYGVRVLKAGASGFLTKESAPNQLIEAIRKIAKGGKYVSESLAEKLITDLSSDSEKPLHKSLSDREFQVLCLIASGKSLTHIASELRLSVKTISSHRTNLLQKMGLKNNAELIHYAIENHLVE